jgi:beta-lactam-binding protein with PASTA domain
MTRARAALPSTAVAAFAATVIAALPPAAPAASLPATCLVPHLTGDTLALARRALSKAHCTLGTITRPRTHEIGVLLVHSQSVPAGRTLESGARVSVTLRASHA